MDTMKNRLSVDLVKQNRREMNFYEGEKLHKTTKHFPRRTELCLWRIHFMGNKRRDGKIENLPFDNSSPTAVILPIQFDVICFYPAERNMNIFSN